MLTVLGKKRHLLPRVLEPPEHHRLSSEAWKITKWHVKLPPWHIPKENSYFFFPQEIKAIMSTFGP